MRPRGELYRALLPRGFGDHCTEVSLRRTFVPDELLTLLWSPSSSSSSSPPSSFLELVFLRENGTLIGTSWLSWDTLRSFAERVGPSP